MSPRIFVAIVLALCAFALVSDAKPRKSPALDKWYINRAKKFHEAWSKEEGVVTLENGLQYKVLAKGPAGNTATPTDDDTVLLRYQVLIPDEDAPYRHVVGANIVWDEEKKELAGKAHVFKMSQLFDGWRRGVKMMNEGDNYMLYVPFDMAFGGLGRSDTRPAIPVFSPVMVNVYLDKINPPAEPKDAQKADPVSGAGNGQNDEEEKQEL